MKTAPSFARCLTWYGKLICLVAALALVGCGGATMSSDGSTSGGGTIVAGVGTGGTGVVRSSASASTSSVLVGAIVFLDTNNNQLLDGGEPFAYTDQDGAYTLQVSPADLAAYPLLIQAVAGATVDKATGQPLAEGFVAPLIP